MVLQKMPSNHFSYIFFRIELSLSLLEQCRHQMLQSSWIILYKQKRGARKKAKRKAEEKNRHEEGQKKTKRIKKETTRIRKET